MRKSQKRIAALLGATVVAIGIVVGVHFQTSYCRLRYAENVILRKEPREESYWRLTPVGDSYLIQVRNGKFHGWYLAADSLMEGVRLFSSLPTLSSIGAPTNEGSRSLVLQDKLGDDCYWQLTLHEGGLHRLRPARGRHRGWYLHFSEGYIPDTGIDPPIAWNLLLRATSRFAGKGWKLTDTSRGYLIQATGSSFDGWYLDALLGAHILERDRCFGKEETRDGPSPPLAPRQ